MTIRILVRKEWAEYPKGEIIGFRSKIDNGSAWVIMVHLIDLALLVFDKNHVNLDVFAGRPRYSLEGKVGSPQSLVDTALRVNLVAAWPPAGMELI